MATHPLFKRHFIVLVFWLIGFLLYAGKLQASVDQPLPAEQAFPVSINQTDQTIYVTLSPQKGYYLYRNRLRIESNPVGLVEEPVLPAGIEKDDPYLGKQAIYPSEETIAVPLKPDTPKQFQLIIHLQGCDEVRGICYPPFAHTVSIGSERLAEPRSFSAKDKTLLGHFLLGKTNADILALNPQGIFQTVIVFFLAGLAMAFTACMYPLLPIVSSLIVGQRKIINRWRGFYLSFAYVQGLCWVYVIIGVVAGFTGSLLTIWLQQPVVILSASALIVIFALSMFDLFSIQLPVAWQSRLAGTSNRFANQNGVAIFIMGGLSALIVGPCMAPPLAIALGYIGNTGNAWLGGVTLYSLAFGMGLPLLVIGTFGGYVLPKAGSWMKTIKAIFGIMMLWLALWLAHPFLNAAVVIGLSAILWIGMAVYLGTRPLSQRHTACLIIGKSAAVIFAILGTIQITGLIAGANDPLRPLQPFLATTNNTASANPIHFEPVSTIKELERQLQKHSNQPVLLDFYADWCVACKEMDNKTFTDPQVQEEIQHFVRLRADVTHNTEDDRRLLRQFGLFGPPGVILFNQGYQQLQPIIGFIAPNEFYTILRTTRTKNTPL